MIGEANIYGIYIPWLGVLALIALPGLWVARRALAAAGLYRWVWHPALFDVGLYLLILFGLTRVTAHL
ncbi:DUF1656 domain-containing protein [Variovorax sp.]|uniref:DUF1656 domain-containing protein n=1 Tax=Variovorax sp. TaxID=1871043 RepID=UPI002D72F5FA|nr:DUF1656 domain-containing protein [Variovorax sp.]HYP86261.1 DUF1656 domain-containing protein [Variovorax sp.]